MNKENASLPKGKRVLKPEFDAESKAFLASHPFTFVNISLGEDEKDAIAGNRITADRLSEFIKEVVIHQYKLSINWDNKHSCYVVSITGAKFFRDDYNRCVTSRHNELWLALAIAEYKFFRLIVNGGIEAPTVKTGEIFD